MDLARLSSRSPDRRFTAAALCLGVVLTLLYGLYLFQNVQLFADYDQMVYRANVVRSLEGATLYNPHHIHFEILGREFHEFMVENFGDAGFTDLAFNLRLRSLVTGVLGFFFLYLFAVFATGSLFFGAAGTLLVGFSHGYFHYATKIDTPIFPAAAMGLILACFLLVERTRRRALVAAILLGIAFGIGIIMHQYVAFACVVAGLVMLVPDIPDLRRLVSPFSRRAAGKRGGSWSSRLAAPPREKEEPRLRRRYGLRVVATLLAGVVGISVVVGAYLWVGRGIYNLPFSGEEDHSGESRGLWRYTTFQRWLFIYETSDSWGYGLESFLPWRTARGYTDAFVTQYEPHVKYNQNRGFEYDIDDPLKPGAVPYNLIAYLTIGVVVACILFFPFLLSRYGRVFLALLLMLPPYFVFFTYWEPFYFEFWLIPTMLVALLGMLILNWLGEVAGAALRTAAAAGPLRRARDEADRPSRGYTAFLGRLPLMLAFGALVFIVATHNVVEYVVPYSREEQREGTASWEDWQVRRMYSESVYRRPLSVRWNTDLWQEEEP